MTDFIARCHMAIGFEILTKMVPASDVKVQPIPFGTHYVSILLLCKAYHHINKCEHHLVTHCVLQCIRLSVFNCECDL